MKTMTKVILAVAIMTVLAVTAITGYEIGFSRGCTDIAGTQWAYDDGYQYGHDAGIEEGYWDGYFEGDYDGYDRCYNEYDLDDVYIVIGKYGWEYDYFAKGRMYTRDDFVDIPMEYVEGTCKLLTALEGLR